MSANANAPGPHVTTVPGSYALMSEEKPEPVYRYTLGRRWDDDLTVGSAVFVMLNPSTADAEVDDRTIGRCRGFAQAMGCGGLHVVNLFAARSTRPVHLFDGTIPDPVGPRNDDIIRAALEAAQEERRPVIVAWGAQANPLTAVRATAVSNLADYLGLDLLCLGVTKGGQPRHPLYLPAATTPEPWSMS